MKANQNKQELIFEANTHPMPHFIIDDFLKTMKGSPTLKVLLVLVRHSTGYYKDNVTLSNSKIANIAGIKDNKQIRRAKTELKNVYKIISYDTCKGGKEISNVKILLPEKFYNKDLNSLESAAKYLEKYGYKVLAPETKGDKKEVLQISENIAPNNSQEIEYWNNFILWANINLSRATKDILKNVKTKFSDAQIIIKGDISKPLKNTISTFIEGQDRFIKVLFED